MLKCLTLQLHKLLTFGLGQIHTRFTLYPVQVSNETLEDYWSSNVNAEGAAVFICCLRCFFSLPNDAAPNMRSCRNNVTGMQ